MSTDKDVRVDSNFKYVKVPTYLLFAIPHYIMFVGIGLSGFVFLIFGIGFLIRQIYRYLDSGFWIPISTISVLKYFKFEWALNPTRMFGLYDLFEVYEISFSLIAAGVFCLLFILIIGNFLGYLLPFRKDVQPWLNNL